MSAGYLDLDTMVVHPLRYGRVVAENIEQLLAFVPEIPYVYGFAKGSSGRWIWTGSEWVQCINIIGQGELSEFDASAYHAGVGVIDEAGTAWISNGTTWDLAQMPDVGEGYAVLTDEDGAVLIDENYNVLVEEV